MLKFLKSMFCSHDWEPYGKGYAKPDGYFSVKYHNRICLKCAKEDNLADIIEAMVKNKVIQETLEEHKRLAEGLHQLAERKRRKKRLAQLDKKPAS